jgi:lipopolysaccharide/colanic/teichoic acid biosynthesis glycosyltransferase
MSNGRTTEKFILWPYNLGEKDMNAVEDKRTAAKKTLLNRDEILKRDSGYWKVRRTQDVILSLVALLVLWPFMLHVALVILLDSPGGSPIFAQTRIGRDGKPFTFYKFRTMRPNAEADLEKLLQYNEMEGPVFKIREDPRITRVGKFLRKSSIDELPQLWNVLRGDMSLVGPRPAIPREVEQYDDYARQRLIVTPGLTCLWQIQPNRNSLTFDEWMELDARYIAQRSLKNDWKIIWATFGAVLGMNGE